MIQRFYLLLCIFFLALYTDNLCAKKSASQIIKDVETRDVGKDFFSTMDMVIVSSSGKEKKRLFHWWRIEEKEGSKDMIKFLEPKRLQNTGLLVHSHDKKVDEQWLFLSKASKKQARRISAADRGSRFLGSDFYFVDFEPIVANEFHSLYLKPNTKFQYKGSQLVGVKLTPKKKDYVYEKMHFWIDSNTSIPIVVEYFQNKRKIKTLTMKQIRKIDGIWSTTDLLMENHGKRSKTQIKMKKLDYNTGLVSDLFSTTQLMKDL